MEPSFIFGKEKKRQIESVQLIDKNQLTWFSLTYIYMCEQLNPYIHTKYGDKYQHCIVTQFHISNDIISEHSFPHKYKANDTYMLVKTLLDEREVFNFLSDKHLQVTSKNAIKRKQKHICKYQVKDKYKFSYSRQQIKDNTTLF